MTQVPTPAEMMAEAMMMEIREEGKGTALLTTWAEQIAAQAAADGARRMQEACVKLFYPPLADLVGSKGYDDPQYTCTHDDAQEAIRQLDAAAIGRGE